MCVVSPCPSVVWGQGQRLGAPGWLGEEEGLYKHRGWRTKSSGCSGLLHVSSFCNKVARGLPALMCCLNQSASVPWLPFLRSQLTPTRACRIKICIFNKTVRQAVCTLEFGKPCCWEPRHSADKFTSSAQSSNKGGKCSQLSCCFWRVTERRWWSKNTPGWLPPIQIHFTNTPARPFIWKKGRMDLFEYLARLGDLRPQKRG